MKAPVLLIAGLIQGFALSGQCGSSPECEARLQAMADHFRDPASRLAGYQLDIKVMVSIQVPEVFDAYADSRGNNVYVAPRVCRYGDMTCVGKRPRRTTDRQIVAGQQSKPATADRDS